MKLFIKLIALMILTFSSFMLYEYYERHQVSKREVLKRIDPLPQTMALVEKERYGEAAEYLGFFMQYDYVKNNPKAKELYEALELKRSSMGYQSQKALEGVLYGKSDETIGKVSAGVSDFFLWGDLRDLTIEGYHYLTGEDVDKVLVALSGIGVVATGVTMLSAGSTTPVKGSVSVLKLIKKSGKMPLWMEKFILRSAKKVKSSQNLKPVKGLFEDIYTVSRVGGLATTAKILEKSPNMKAFRNSLGFAKTFGKESGVLFRILGDDAVLYYRLLKDKSSKKVFLKAATYGKAGIVRLAKLGEKGFLKSLKPVVKGARLTKVFSKHVSEFFYKLPTTLYLLLFMGSVGVLLL